MLGVLHIFLSAMTENFLKFSPIADTSLLINNVLIIKNSIYKAESFLNNEKKFNNRLWCEFLINNLKYINVLTILRDRYINVTHCFTFYKSSKRCIINYVLFILIILKLILDLIQLMPILVLILQLI
jgi:hypothetical protein